MTDNVNIQILEALGYWNRRPFETTDEVRWWLKVHNRGIPEPYTHAKLESAANYAIKNRLNWREEG